MSDMDDAKMTAAIEYLKTQCKLIGVASLRVDDGSMFMFSKETVEKMIKGMNDSGREEVLIFVKDGSLDANKN